MIEQCSVPIPEHVHEYVVAWLTDNARAAQEALADDHDDAFWRPEITVDEERLARAEQDGVLVADPDWLWERIESELADRIDWQAPADRVLARWLLDVLDGLPEPANAIEPI